jgi:hypothetical protein
MTTTAVAEERQAEDVPGFAQDARANVSFARQPILNRDNMLCAFELKLYQAPAAESSEQETEGEQPEAQASAAGSIIPVICPSRVSCCSTTRSAACPPIASCSSCRPTSSRTIN